MSNQNKTVEELQKEVRDEITLQEKQDRLEDSRISLIEAKADIERYREYLSEARCHKSELEEEINDLECELDTDNPSLEIPK